MALMHSPKMTAVPKLSYLHISRHSVTGTTKKLFNFRNFVLLKGSTFHLKDKKNSDIGALKQ